MALREERGRLKGRGEASWTRARPRGPSSVQSHDPLLSWNVTNSEMLEMNNFFLWQIKKAAKFHFRVEIVLDDRKFQRLKWP